MFIDTRTLSANSKVNADVCIVGAGAAGITLARELASKSISVCLLESGGFDFDDKTQSLYKGDNVGRPYFSLDVTRLRFFGGSTNHWGGMCRPLDAIDFEKRDWVPYSGWPFSGSVLAPYYARAQDVCMLGPNEYEADFWAKQLETSPWPFDPEVIQTGVFQFNELRFGEAYRSEIEKSQVIKVFLHANVTDISLDASAGKVASVEIRTLEGGRATCEAKHFILASGGIENPRLLLLADRQHAQGIGNAHDLVGRFFMDHIDCSSAAGAFQFSNSRVPSKLYDETKVGEIGVRGSVRLSEGLMQREKLGNFCAVVDVVRSEGVPSLKYLGYQLREGKMPRQIGQHLWNVMRDFDGITDYALRNLYGVGIYSVHEEVQRVELLNLLEQVPNPDSRLTLSDETDALGQRRLKLDWRFTELDWRTLRRSHEVIGMELGKGGLGRFRMDVSEIPNEWPEQTRGAHHHMGTTRMHDDPKQGVTDGNCRVHGVANLWIAGSSVFPTGGYANPTLTLVALAIRLADKLKESMA